MPDGPFASYAQNAEDVVLRRALGTVKNGRYIDVGAFDPVVHSVTKQLYDAGWRGLNIEPVPDLHAELTRGRPEDVNLQVAAGAEPGTHRFHVVRETGLSTLRDDIAAHHSADGRQVVDVEVEVVTLDALISEHLDGQQVHLLKIDVEGAEPAVLAGIDLVQHRPWVLVIEATRPLTSEPTHADWEPDLLARGYDYCMFDGLSRWYVAAEHSERLRPLLSYPACVLDDYLAVDAWQALQRADRASRQAEVWRAEAIEHAILERSLRGELHDLKDLVARTQWLVNEVDVLTAKLAEAQWHGGLLDQERVWLRGLLEEQAGALEQQDHAPRLPAGRLGGAAGRVFRAYRRLTSARAS